MAADSFKVKGGKGGNDSPHATHFSVLLIAVRELVHLVAQSQLTAATLARL